MIFGQNDDHISFCLAGGLIPGASWDAAGTFHFLDMLHVFVQMIMIRLLNLIVVFFFFK